ncbi:MAG: PAS domain-containing protein [Oligoflexia bacterium]|nr:PAS domain-containing protein [Oligoflexia bacterium]
MIMFKGINIPRRCFLRVSMHFTLLIVFLFIYLFITKYSTINNITETLSKNKLIQFSDKFISSYKSTYEKTSNEKKTFDIVVEIFKNHSNIHFIKINDDKKNILFMFADITGKNIYSEIIRDKPNSKELSDNTFEILKSPKSLTSADKKYATFNKVFTLKDGQSRYLKMLIAAEEIKKDVPKMLIDILIIILIVMLFTVPLIFLSLNFFLKPIHKLSLEIQKIKLDTPVLWRQLKQNESNDFLKEIIVSVNELIFRSQRSLICQENLGRFLAHEIKTPLTHLMNEIEEMDRKSSGGVSIANSSSGKSNKEFCKESIQSVLRIRTIVNNICDLAYIDSNLFAEKKTNIVKLLSETILEFERIYTTNINFEKTFESNEEFAMISPDYFWILCSNILRNSLDHGHGREIAPLVQLSQSENKYKIEFKDYGPGFPFSNNILERINSEENIEQLLKSRGTGLVLCIKISEIMGIEIKFRNHLPQGTSVTLLLENINATSLEENNDALSAETIINIQIDLMKKKLKENEKYIAIANKEIQSSNTNMQFLNEELYTANEELKNSNDELLDVNQELTDINNELQNKISELTNVRNDMNNLLIGSSIGTILLDHQLCIKRFSPFIAQIFNFLQSDIGKQIENTNLKLNNFDEIISDIRNVLSTLIPKKIEAQTYSNEWFLLNIRPYRTIDNVIDGAVISFIEITDIKKQGKML